MPNELRLIHKATGRVVVMGEEAGRKTVAKWPKEWEIAKTHAQEIAKFKAMPEPENEGKDNEAIVEIVGSLSGAFEEMSDLENANMEGRQAYTDGKFKKDCPYNRGTKLHKAWSQGYDDLKETMEGKQ